MSALSSTCDKCNANVSSLVEKVTSGNSCRECGRYRFEPTELSYLYLLTHPKLKLSKIGIGTVGKDKGRLENLLKDGWLAHGIWHADQRQTFLWEKKIFAEIKRAVSSEEFIGAEPMGRWVDTWSESVNSEAISTTEIAQIIQKIIKS